MIVVLMSAVGAAAATDVQFVWNANTEPDMGEYRIYQSATPGIDPAGMTPVAIIPAPATSYLLVGVPDGGFYWVLTAVDTTGNESGPSNEVTLGLDSTAPGSPSGLTVDALPFVSVTRPAVDGPQGKITNL